LRVSTSRLAAIALALASAAAAAHGVLLDAAYDPESRIASASARFDTGEPMADAEVTVFAPDDPSTPWLRGRSDGAGAFRFEPDPARPGYWAVQMRHDDHGAITTFRVEDAESGGGHQ